MLLSPKKNNQYSGIQSLRKLTDKELEIISSHFHIRSYADDESIYKINTPALVVYILIEGEERSRYLMRMGKKYQYLKDSFLEILLLMIKTKDPIARQLHQILLSQEYSIRISITCLISTNLLKIKSLMN